MIGKASSLHADFAVNDGDAVLSSLLGLLQRRDGAAEQQQCLGDVALRGLEPPLIPVLGLGEQRTHVLLEHGECCVRESGSQAGDLGHEDSRPPRGLEIGDVLHGHDRAFIDQSTEAGGMNSSRALGTNPKAARVFEPVEQSDDVGGCWRLRIIPQPGEARAVHLRIDRQQAFECVALGVGQIIRQGLKGLPSSAHPSRQSDPLQHGRCGQKHIGSPQMGEHCQDDRLAAIGGPRSVRAHLQAGPPVGQPEVPQAEMLLQLDRVLPAGLIPECVVGKCGWGYSELLSHKYDHRLWRVLVRSQALARIPEEA